MELRELTVARLQAMAKRMRRNMLDMAYGAGSMGSHVGPGLSIVEIVAVLYGAVMRVDPNNPLWPERDRFILSKGHGALAFYTALAEAGLISRDELKTYEEPESYLTGQPGMCVEKGIEVGSGSLGHGLSIGIGMAIAGTKAQMPYQTFVVVGDGECNEGSIWEAAMAAAHFKLSNLTAIVDANGIQSDGRCETILDMGPHEKKWESFGWEAIVVDGHDVEALLDAFTAPRQYVNKPRVLIAKTVKGKGVSFMENNNDWHHNRLTQKQHESAMTELAD
jgi:transketolase